MKREKVELEKIITEEGGFGNIAIRSKTTDGRYVISGTCELCQDKKPRLCEFQSTYCDERIWMIQDSGEIYLGSRDRIFNSLKDAAKLWLSIHFNLMDMGIIRFEIKKIRRVDEK
jgi:hypothetical protein